ncbi:BT4734/BF3469 family protein [Bacteroides rodentium]|uniref:BT4734/BF3469 family protein n=1 Tax=Bacteroides rodentium TaxID=691816 RepID=UPI000A93D713|nr:BT4734/BF3469 family protein [Bacteroides rodentium]
MEKIICPAAEYTRSKEGERYLKTYNGLVQIEVNHLALLTDPSGSRRKTRGTEYHVVKKEESCQLICFYFRFALSLRFKSRRYEKRKSSDIRPECRRVCDRSR